MQALKNKIYGILGALALSCCTTFLPFYAQQTPPPADTAAQAAPADTLPGAAPPSAIVPAEPSQMIPTNQFDLSVGYNLKMTVRMAPVYQDSTLTSEIIDYLPRGSVVGVISVLDTWYKIQFGPEEARKQGWVISYGVERTPESEHVVTNREDINRWAGQQVIVTAGEAPVRSFPSTGGEILLRSYRNEIFSIAGESEDYFMIVLSNAVKGWVWKGDVQPYVQPKYPREQVREMVKTANDNENRLNELNNLLSELKSRSLEVDRQLETLTVLDEKLRAAAAQAERGGQRKPFFQFDSLKNRSALRAGFLKQNFGAKLGLASTTFKGFGFNYRPAEKLSFDLNYLSGNPAALQPGSEQAGLPSSLSGLDTLSISAKFLQAGLRYAIGGLRGVPIFSRLDNFLLAGIGRLALESQAAGINSTQQFWGAILGWEFSRRLFSRIEIEAGLKFFLTRAEVTDIRLSGSRLLASEKVFLTNRALYFGARWNF